MADQIRKLYNGVKGHKYPTMAVHLEMAPMKTIQVVNKNAKMQKNNAEEFFLFLR